MAPEEFRQAAEDGTTFFVRAFVGTSPKAVVQIVHGLAEHGARYARLATELSARGFAVYASDQRGHGKTPLRPDELGHFADRDGWNKLVGDQWALQTELKRRHPSLPVIVLGHSMGSYVARELAIRHGGGLAGLAISGTTHDRPAAYKASQLVAMAERLRLGPHGKSALIKKLAFDSFNKPFEPARTPFEWLSRDPAEVDLYVHDPLCGFECTTQLWIDLLGGMAGMCMSRRIARMPKTLPVYIMSGEQDPVHRRLAGIRQFQAALSQAGLEAVTCRVYPGARHELTNELNRDEVTRDLIAWLDTLLG